MAYLLIQENGENIEVTSKFDASKRVLNSVDSSSIDLIQDAYDTGKMIVGVDGKGYWIDMVYMGERGSKNYWKLKGTKKGVPPKTMKSNKGRV